MSKLHLRRRISRLLTGEDDFTIRDIIIHRINPRTGAESRWGSLRNGPDKTTKDKSHEQNSTPQENQ